MKLFTISFLTLFLFGTAAAQEPAPAIEPIIAEIFLAKADIDGKAGNAAENFLVTDVPIFCVVRLVSPGVVSVRMDLIAVNVRGVDQGEKVVTTSYTTKSNEDRVNFKGRPHGLWVAGKYRAEIFISGKKVRNLEFEIKASSTEAEKPRNLQPTRKIKKRSIASRDTGQTFSRFFL